MKRSIALLLSVVLLLGVSLPRASVFGTWFAGVRPDDTDYVLLIQKA